MKYYIIDETIFKPISSLKYIKRINIFIAEKLFYKTPPWFGENLKFWPNYDLNGKDLDKLGKMLDPIKKTKIKIECVEHFFDIYEALNYFFEETLNRKNSKKKIDKKYYKIGSKLMNILQLDFVE